MLGLRGTRVSRCRGLPPAIGFRDGQLKGTASTTRNAGFPACVMHMVDYRSPAPDNREHKRQRAVDEIGEDGFDDGVAAVVISASEAGSPESVKNGWCRQTGNSAAGQRASLTPRTINRAVTRLAGGGESRVRNFGDLSI